VRLYLPTTLDALAGFVAAGVVEGVEGYLPDGDDEVSEHAALMQAAEESAGLPGGGGRRVVVVAELGDTEDPDAPVPLRRVVAVHADAAPRPADADPDDDLGWYATQELPALLDPRPGA
jgi:hypothetical protein